MAKTNKQESRRVKQGESEAHKLRRTYKDEIDHFLELDKEEQEDIDLDLLVQKRVQDRSFE